MLFRFPPLQQATKYLARITAAACWGMLMRDTDMDVVLQATFAAVLGVIYLFLSQAFWQWDRGTRDAARYALYGLLVVGEFIAMGAVVLAALSAFSEQQWLPAMLACAFGGSFSTVFANLELMKDNMRLRRGSITE